MLVCGTVRYCGRDMTTTEKKIDKFLRNPTSLKYTEIVSVLGHFGFEQVGTKGSHVKFKHINQANDLIIPIHNNECKNFYKLEARRRVRKIMEDK
jgi:predicted RNA binding protein YcfA (HicA-like mRNA interferase family)